MQLRATHDELVLLDHVLTSQVWEQDVVDRLVEGWHAFREQIGDGLAFYGNTARGKEATDVAIEISESERKVLLAILPILFKQGGIPVGYELKCKLYKLGQVPQVFYGEEQKANVGNKPSKDTAST